MRDLDSCRCWRCTLCPCKVRNKFLVNFWNRTTLLCIPCISFVSQNLYWIHVSTKFITLKSPLNTDISGTNISKTFQRIPVQFCRDAKSHIVHKPLFLPPPPSFEKDREWERERTCGSFSGSYRYPLHLPCGFFLLKHLRSLLINTNPYSLLNYFLYLILNWPSSITPTRILINSIPQ